MLTKFGIDRIRLSTSLSKKPGCSRPERPRQPLDSRRETIYKSNREFRPSGRMPRCRTANDSRRGRNFGVWKKVNPKPFDKSEPTRKSVDFLQGEEMVKGEKRKAMYQAQKRLTVA